MKSSIRRISGLPFYSAPDEAESADCRTASDALKWWIALKNQDLSAARRSLHCTVIEAGAHAILAVWQDGFCTFEQHAAMRSGLAVGCFADHCMNRLGIW